MSESTLYEMLRNKYQIGDHFIRAYLSNSFGNPHLDMLTFEQKLAENPKLAHWLDYALSTNLRGRDFVAKLRPHFPANAHRYLDVGSAFGGYLVGFMELGLDVVGIEYNQKFVEMSRANLRDYGCEDATIQGDILDPALLARLGKFDIITCIDVIEHVPDVPATMHNMADLLNPGGLLILITPNRDSIANVISDPHFGLFGITLLKHEQAHTFFSHHFPPMAPYDVGEFYKQHVYLDLLLQNNCIPEVLDPLVPTSIKQQMKSLPQFFRLLGKLLCTGSPSLPLRLDVTVRALLYLTGLVFRTLLALPVYALRPALKARYADNAWLILGHKKG